MTKPHHWARMCPKCQRKPVAYPKAVYCYDCRTRYRRPAPPCKRCGSQEDYWSNGLCVWCHKYGRVWATSCKFCLCWGVFRQPRLICSGCHDWRKRNPGESPCRTCGHAGSVNADGECRLCYRRRRALARLEGGDVTDNRRAEAIAGGHQLFIDGMEHKLALALAGPKPRGRNKFPLLHPTAHNSRKAPRPGAITPVIHRQPVLFDLPRVMERNGRPVPIPEPPLLDLAESLEAVAVEYGQHHGWKTSTVRSVRQGLRILLALQDTPGAPIRASETSCLQQYSTLSRPTRPILDILAAAGMLDDDRVPTIVAWFQRETASLPGPIGDELGVWFDVMRNGSTIPPRQLPREDRTTRNNLTYALPAIRRWAERHESLREVSRDDVLEALRGTGSRRNNILCGLRSIFKVLKGRKLVFVNPTARIRTDQPNFRIPTPLDAAELQPILQSPDPAQAALGALMIFHGLRPLQLRSLKLTDVRDGRLCTGRLVILLATQVRERLASYLDHRARRWPTSANPHMFINVITANRTTEVNYAWVNRKLGILAHRIRDDRILDELQATAGDLRRISDLFGLEIASTMRYAATLNHPDLDADT